MSEAFLFGLNHKQLADFNGVQIHQDIFEALTSLKNDAAKEGFDLQLTSGFRGFERQLSIWNAKAQGSRKLLDDQGQALEFKKLQPLEVLYSILRWSALPGASRHHWGTDIDIYDANALPHPDYEVDLTPLEVEGIFAPFHQWLSEKIKNNQSYGFYRPYQNDLGGVAPEMWHLSYAPLSDSLLTELSLDNLRDFISQQHNLELKDLVLSELENIYEKFVMNITPAPFN